MKSVLGELRLTLYDIFGYLVPGLVALAGFAIFFWAVYVPDHKPDADLKGVLWTALLLVAYLMGHLIQAIANSLPRFAFRIEKEWREDAVAGRFAAMIEAALRAKHLLPTASVPPDSEPVYRICDELVVQKGETGERELYTYREGFYRGMAVALVLLAVGLFARFEAGAATVIGDKEHTVTRGMFIFFLLVVVLAAIASYARYRRFARYRVRTVLLGAPILLADSPESSGKKKSDAPKPD